VFIFVEDEKKVKTLNIRRNASGTWAVRYARGMNTAESCLWTGRSAQADVSTNISTAKGISVSPYAALGVSHGATCRQGRPAGQVSVQ